MSKPTPTTGRRISREEINARSEESSTEASSEDSPSGTDHKKANKPPAVEQRPRPRAGTWVAATAGSGAPSSSNEVRKPEEKTSEPALSPRGPLPPLPKSHGHAVPSSSGPSIFAPITSIPSTSSPSASKLAAPKTAPYVKSKVPAELVPDSLANVLRAGYKGTRVEPDPNNPAKLIQFHIFNIPPKQIARLLVGLESKFYDNKPSSDNLNKPLRDRFGIVGFKVSDSNQLDEINLIEQILQPFVQRMFEGQGAEQARIEVRERFNTFVSGPYKSMLKTEEAKISKEGTLQNLSFRNQFDSVIQPLESYICGPQRSLDSSLLPEDFKLLLKEVVRSYFSWSEKQNIPPEQLTSMIKSALTGLLFIRGLLPIWTNQLEADLQTKQQTDREWGQFKGKLSAQLAHYSSFLFDDFVFDIVASTPGKPAAFEDYFKPLQKASELRRKEAAAASNKQEISKRTLARGSTISGSTNSSSNKRTNIGSFIQGLVSPRKKETSSTSAIPVSPRAVDIQSSDGLLLKKTGMRETNAKRKRAAELGDYLKSIKLPNREPGYMRHLNEALAKRANYEDFVNAPAAFCLDQLKKYAQSLRQEGQEFPENLKQTQDFLVGVANTEREQAKRDVEQAKRQAPTNTASTRAASGPTVASVSVPALNLGAMANSPFADDSISTSLNLGEFAKSPFADDPSEADEIPASSKTESSDSTEIETESSEGVAAITEQKEKTSPEKG